MIGINIMSILHIALSVILISAFFFFLNALTKNKRNPDKLLIGADKAFAKGKLKKSEKKYKKIIQRAGKKEVNGIIGKAYLGLGKIFEIKKDGKTAIAHYAQALKNSVPVPDLPMSAISLLSQSFCSNEDSSSIAIQVYLELIKQKPLNKETGDRKSTRLNSSHIPLSRMPSSA